MMCISYVHAVLPCGQFSAVYLLEGWLQQICVSLLYCGPRTCIWSGAIVMHVFTCGVAIPKSAC